MANFKFWEDWNKKYQFYLLGCALLPVVAVGLFFIAYIVGDSWFYQWETIPEMDYAYIPTASFIDHYQEFQMKAFNYVVQESFKPKIMHLDERVGFIYFGIIAVAFSLFLTVSTTLKRTYFYLSLVASMVFLAFLGLDVLEIFEGKSTAKPILLTCITVYAITSYLIFSFWTNLSLIQRTLIFFGLTSIIGIVIFTLSPFSAHAISLSILGYGTICMIPLTILFTMIVSIEPVSIMLYMNNGRSKFAQGRGSVYRFLITAGVYIALTTVIFLNQKGYVDFDFKGIDVFLLLGISAILGFWGFRRRFGSESRIENLQYTLIYIVISSMALSSIGYAIITDNTPLIKMYSWAIAVIFMCYGIAFTGFLLYNFLDQFMNKQNVFRIMFKPGKMYAFHMWIMGLIAILALEFRGSYKQWFESKSGYYNFVGDTYFKQSNYDLARKFYFEAKRMSYRNHRSNYCLAQVIELEKDYNEAIQYYDDATEEEPTVHAYASKASIYAESDRYFKAVFTLNDGLKIFPNSPYLLNNYALLLKKGSMNDSALAVFTKSLQFSESSKYDHVQFNNIFGHYLRNGMYKEAENMAGLDIQDPVFETNKLVLANLKKEELKTSTPFTKPFRIGQKRLAHMLNYSMNGANIRDTNTRTQLDEAIVNDLSVYFREDLIYSMAYLNFVNHNFEEAEPIITDLANGNSTMNFHYANVAGLWYMTQKKYKEAQKYFSISMRAKHPDALYNMAIVSTILKEKGKARELWQRIHETGGVQVRNQASMFVNVLGATMESVDSLSEEELLNYTVFLADKNDLPALYEIGKKTGYKRIFDEIYAQHLLNKNQLDLARTILDQFNEKDGEKYWLLEGIYYTKSLDYEKGLEIFMNQQYSDYTSYDWVFYRSFNLHKTGNLNDALKGLNVLLKKYPYHEGAVLEKTDLFNGQNQIQKGYDFITTQLREKDATPLLMKGYILQCIKMNYLSFAREAMPDLKELVSLQEYESFETIYNARMDEWEKANGDEVVWEDEE